MAKPKQYRGAKEKREAGGFVPLPFVVIRSESYARLSAHAVKLLNDLMAQYKGGNNGDLCAAWTFMEKRFWKSKGTLYKALRELREKYWIVVSRQGGRNRASLYALTFFAIDECKGKLDIKSTHSPSGLWRCNEPAPRLERIAPPMNRDFLQIPRVKSTDEIKMGDS